MSAAPDWEQGKENAAPLERGRNVTTLGRGAGGLQDRKDLERKISHYESLVRPSEAPHVVEMDDDPLEHWLGYIKFYQNTFPTDSHEQFLLMERCTRALIKMKQYADDDRFIGVCAKYADKTKEPMEVFKYLHQQKVGVNCALFWVAWAFVAERANDFAFAEKIFKKGTSKKAQPLQLIKTRHQQFQRRMSRHWLNSSQHTDDIDDEENDDGSSSRSRGVLGGLPRDRLRRNDRTASMRQTQNRSSITFGGGRQQVPSQSNNSNVGSNSSFAIFQDDGENADNGYNLDQSFGDNSRRVIERQADRKKENTMEAERWNERGGLASRRQPRSRSKGPPPAFAVFVDEECAAQHESEEARERSEFDRQRRDRDERTFKERSDEGMAERLARDPLRYLRDPSQLESDRIVKEQKQTKLSDNTRTAPNAKSEQRKRTGFSKRLLQNAHGEEQSFEEARANSMCFTLAPPSVNFNLLHVTKEDQSSQMDLDEEDSADISMEDLGKVLPSVQNSSASKQPRKIPRMESKLEGRALFRPESSFDASLNQTAISTASSTIHEIDGVGLPTRKEEETINTKFAMKELSMMFSSPACGTDEIARKTERAMNTTILDNSNNDVSYDNVVDIMDNRPLDNSIFITESAGNAENDGPQNPFARSMGTPGFQSMALRQLEGDSDDDRSLTCQVQTRRSIQRLSQDNPLPRREKDVEENPGFRIFEDEGSSIAEDAVSNNGPSFSVYDENVKTANNKIQSTKKSGFTIFEEEDDSESNVDTSNENGDTASLSVFAGAVAMLDNDTNSGNHTPDSQSTNTSGDKRHSNGDTASISLFNEVFSEIADADSPAGNTKKVPPSSSKSSFAIFVDDETQDQDNSSQSTNSPRSSSYKDKNKNVPPIDYATTHEHESRFALRSLQSSSLVPDSRISLQTLLSSVGHSFHLPHVLLPRVFRKKSTIPSNIELNIGKYTGLVSSELGRGTYGVVVLMESGEESDQSIIAVKAQTPTSCLALEYEILCRMEERLSPNYGLTYPFPRPLSFLSLADGGIFSMTAGSRSGLNLVDLSNFYRLKLGEAVPEILALYYTSRMLKHVELLHWHGKILHCDIKADNFVLCTLECLDNAFKDIEYSDLFLVDFGRAIDLEKFSDQYEDVRNTMFLGNASCRDMMCVAMKNNTPWSYDIDTFGILSSAHVLLYGTHLEIRKKGDYQWHPTSRLRRYWQKDLWDEIFNSLLNLDEMTGTAIGSRARSLRNLRDKIENYLRTEKEKLSALLTRQATLLPKSREKLI